MSLATEPSERLVTLSTGQPGLRGLLHIEARVPGEIENQNSKIENTLDFISSDSTLDRYGEIISPAGWHLGTYRRNPVFQNAHQYGDILFTLGKALVTEIRSGPSTINSQPSTCLFQRIQFATDVNPMARIAYGLYRGKFLNAVSVGFIPIRWEDNPSEPGPGEFSALSTTPTNASTFQSKIENQKSKIPKRKYLEQELLEVSAVAIPANPNALALAYKSGALEKSDLKETADLINYTLPAPPIDQSTHPPIHPLLALVREVRDLMKRA